MNQSKSEAEVYAEKCAELNTRVAELEDWQREERGKLEAAYGRDEAEKRIAELEAEIEQLRQSPWPPEEIAMKTRAQLAMGLAVASNRIAKLEETLATEKSVRVILDERIAALEEERGLWRKLAFARHSILAAYRFQQRAPAKAVDDARDARDALAELEGS